MRHIIFRPATRRRPKPHRRRSPFACQIASLADTTARLPSPLRSRVIRVVRAMVALFRCQRPEGDPARTPRPRR
jgi:hypothetical protein